VTVDAFLAQAVDPSVVRPLRLEILRPGYPPESVVHERDGAPGAAHAAVLRDGRALAIGSVMPDGYPREERNGDWRVRGMATRADMRGQGLGALVLGFLEAHARGEEATRLWCNARIGARTFYERAGLSIEGDMFEIESIGPHFLMSKHLR
jgi:GNAT superfamily N-acetyltransferase